MDVKNTAIAMVLGVVGTLAMVGDLAGNEMLYGLGMLTHASPAPKVFTTRDGLEGFSATYTLGWSDDTGTFEHELDPETYAKLTGPYNRRNVYGAALAGGPFLADHPALGDLHARVSTYAFCEGNVLRELGLSEVEPHEVWLVVEPREGTETTLPLRLEVEC